MREYGRIYSKVWESDDFRSLTEDGRMLVLYLLTSPHTNLTGCFRIPVAYAAHDLKWVPERVREGLGELSAKGFITLDAPSEYVLITRFLAWNAFENGNVAKAAEKFFDALKVVALKPLLAKAFLEFGKHLSEEFRNRLQTVRQPTAIPEPEPEPEPNQSQSPVSAGPAVGDPAAPAPSVPEAGKAKPKAAAPKSESKGGQVWEAYCEGYLIRYGVPAVRNAKANSLCAQLVDRLGAEEAPEVARYYVEKCGALFYVRSGHALEALVKDAEKLRTEWATGREITEERARQSDRKATTGGAINKLLAMKAAEEEDFHGQD